ncbi:MAG: alanine dehydrogenase [Chitinophagia bacterium]|nr:alanine dehydrogenase [Chitinophagia bacterium]
MKIGLIRERKKIGDNRVALTPMQCMEIPRIFKDVLVVVEASPDRCISNEEYINEGVAMQSDMSDCDVLLGIKEVPPEHLIAGKTYLFFSHTKKKQPSNKPLMQALIQKGVRMIDYECLTHADEQRILGFGFYAGIVGAHNGLQAYGKKFNLYILPSAHRLLGYQELLRSYEKIMLPPVKIAVTGSGKVASGILELLHQIGIESVEPADYLTHEYAYPVFTHLKGQHLYARKDDNSYHRDDFHAHPEKYKCLFRQYTYQTDVLMNGIYWEEKIDRLFAKEDVKNNNWRIAVIADVTCDPLGSVPINLDVSTIQSPVYGIDRNSLTMVEPYQPNKQIIDIMAVDNLPNELPRDASHYFGTQLIKFILPELLKPQSDIIQRATICENGHLTEKFGYLSDYAYT